MDSIKAWNDFISLFFRHSFRTLQIYCPFDNNNIEQYKGGRKSVLPAADMNLNLHSKTSMQHRESSLEMSSFDGKKYIRWNFLFQELISNSALIPLRQMKCIFVYLAPEEIDKTDRVKRLGRNGERIRVNMENIQINETLRAYLNDLS